MKDFILPILAVVSVIIMICIIIFLPKVSNDNNSENETTNTISNSENEITNTISNTENEENSNATDEENSTEASNIATISSASNSSSKSQTIEATINDNQDLEISLDSLDTDNATFVKYTSNGTNMELVAIKDDDGNIDVAFNTCQVCNGSPKAYFVQKNGKLVCQNCGNSFSLKTIGASANGCNPMTISDSNITKTENGITISKDYMAENETLFTNVAEH